MEYKKIATEADKYQQRLNEEGLKAGGAVKEFTQAAMTAHQHIKVDDLLPTVDEFGGTVYTQEQVAKAACFAREDAIATLILQKTQLEHFHMVKAQLGACLVLLAYIAYKVT